MRLFDIDVSDADPDLVSDRCWAAGAAGIWETGEVRWRVGVPESSVAAFVDALADRQPVDVTDVAAVELATREVTVGGLALIVPPTVFGDGDHPTTVGCLAALGDVVSAGDRLLDVGCGTGVLAIAAALAGALVTAVDIDPAAVEATVANAAINGVDIDASTTAVDAIAGSFDVVVSNMTAGKLGPLLPDLVRCTDDPGHLIVSGILDDQWPWVESEIVSLFSDRAVAVSHASRDGWVTATARVAPGEL